MDDEAYQRMDNEVYIIYLENEMLLSKKTYNNWREIQDEYYEKYKTNLSPMTCEEIISFFEDDFGEESNWLFLKEDIINFFESEDVILHSKKHS